MVNQFPHSHIIEEKKWFGATGQDVVDAVIDDVNTDGIMLVQSVGNLQLGTYRVGT